MPNCCATKYDDSSRPKTGNMAKGNNKKVTAKKDNQAAPLSPRDEGQAVEGSTHLQTNKATELIAEKEMATYPKRTQPASTETTDHGP